MKFLKNVVLGKIELQNSAKSKPIAVFGKRVSQNDLFHRENFSNSIKVFEKQ